MENAALRGKAMITGATSGIGKATAIAFAQAGFDLCLISRSPSKLEQVSHLLQEYGGKVETAAIDLAELSTVKNNISAIAQKFGNPEILINNAGMGYTNFFGDTTLEDWQKVLDLNLTSVFQCVMAVLPSMRKEKKGTIVNVASIAAQNAFPQWGIYCISKAALLMFSQCLAQEERANGIRVTTICPGAVDTPIWDTETVQVEMNRSAMLTPETVAQAILNSVLLPQEAVIEQLTITPALGTL